MDLTISDTEAHCALVKTGSGLPDMFSARLPSCNQPPLSCKPIARPAAAIMSRPPSKAREPISPMAENTVDRLSRRFPTAALIAFGNAVVPFSKTPFGMSFQLGGPDGSSDLIGLKIFLANPRAFSRIDSRICSGDGPPVPLPIWKAPPGPMGR